jgi:flagellar hook-associated protein 3 FlgL
MRITGKMMSSNAVSNIQSNMERLDVTNDQLSKGTKINLPQDDPGGAVRTMSYKTSLNEIEKYIDNTNNAKSYLSTTDTALGQMGEILQRVRELSIQAANDSFEQTSRDAVASEVNELIEQLVVIGNSSVGSRYIFAGYNTLEKPFKFQTGQEVFEETGQLPNLIDTEGNERKNLLIDDVVNVEYTGDEGILMVEVDKGVVMDYSVPGKYVLKSEEGDLFEHLMTLRNNIYKGDTQNDFDQDGTTIEKEIGELDVIFSKLMRFRSQVGAKMRRVEQVQTRLKDTKISMSDMLSETQDTDMTKKLMDLKVQENVQRMSLSVGSRVIQPTLVDFLK